MGEEQRLGIRQNGFKGKTHSIETKSKLSDAKIGKKLTAEHKKSISKGLLEREGEHFMKNGGLYAIWVKKHGKIVADIKLEEYKNKITPAKRI